MSIQIPSEILSQIKKLGEETRKELEENIIKITRQNNKTVLKLKDKVVYIDKKSEKIDNKRSR
jgi:dynactin complex subunit